MARRGWINDVVTNDPDADKMALRDTAFADQYSEFYNLHPVSPLTPSPFRDTAIGRVYTALKEKMSLQDDELGTYWRPAAAARAIDLSRELKPDVFVTFAQPWVDHTAGLRVKKKTPSLPWVAHFSDPWVDSLYVRGANKSEFRRWSRQERAVIKSADTIIFVSERTANLVMKKYPPSWIKKVHIVPHAYDTDLRARLPARQSELVNQRIKIVHTGNLYGSRHPLFLLDALAKVRRIHPDTTLPSVVFIGNSAKEYRTRVNELGLDGVVEFVPSVGYLDALAAASGADVLLTIDADSNDSVFFPSKIVDYFMLGKPILALTPVHGTTADVLRSHNHFCVESSNIEEIASAIVSLVALFDRGRPTFIPPAEYDIDSTAAKFELALNAAIASSSSMHKATKDGAA